MRDRYDGRGLPCGWPRSWELARSSPSAWPCAPLLARITRDSGSADTRLASNAKRVPFPLVATARPVLLHEINVVAARRVRAKEVPLRAARHENPRQVAGRHVVVDLAVIAENQEARSIASGRVPAERHAGGADLKAEHAVARDVVGELVARAAVQIEGRDLTRGRGRAQTIVADLHDESEVVVRRLVRAELVAAAGGDQEADVVLGRGHILHLVFTVSRDVDAEPATRDCSVGHSRSGPLDANPGAGLGRATHRVAVQIQLGRNDDQGRFGAA